MLLLVITLNYSIISEKMTYVHSKTYLISILVINDSFLMIYVSHDI